MPSLDILTTLREDFSNFVNARCFAKVTVSHFGVASLAGTKIRKFSE